MIYALASDIATRLQARKYPVSVFYGPERVSSEQCDSMRIVFERDVDAIPGAVLGWSNNPRATGVRSLGVLATVEVSSGLVGARLSEHQHECDNLVDALLVELYAWGAESRAGYLPVTETRYLSPEERAGSERSNGVAYAIRFQVPRGVYRRDYEGNAASEVSSYGAGGSVRLELPDGEYEVVS